jgi:hypothetical protein
VPALAASVGLPLPVEGIERSGAVTVGAPPTVTVVAGTLAVAVVPVVVTVVVGAATVVVVPFVETEPDEVDAVTAVGLTWTVPVLERLADAVASVTLAVVPVADAVGAVVEVEAVVLELLVVTAPVLEVPLVVTVAELPLFGSLTVTVWSSGGGSAKATSGAAIERAIAITPAAMLRFARSMSQLPFFVLRAGSVPALLRVRTGATPWDR